MWSLRPFLHFYPILLALNLIFQIAYLAPNRMQKNALTFHAYEHDYDATHISPNLFGQWQYDYVLAQDIKISDSKAFACFEDGTSTETTKKNCGIAISQSTRMCTAIAEVGNNYTAYKKKIAAEALDVFKIDNLNADISDLVVSKTYDPASDANTIKKDSYDFEKFSPMFSKMQADKNAFNEHVYFKYPLAKDSCIASRIQQSSFYANDATSTGLFGMHNSKIIFFWINWILLHSVLTSIAYLEREEKNTTKLDFFEQGENILESLIDFIIIFFSQPLKLLWHTYEENVYRHIIEELKQTNTLLVLWKLLSIPLLILLFLMDYVHYHNFQIEDKYYTKTLALGSYFYAFLALLFYYFIDMLYDNRYLGCEEVNQNKIVPVETVKHPTPYAQTEPAGPSSVLTPDPAEGLSTMLNFKSFRTQAFQADDVTRYQVVKTADYKSNNTLQITHIHDASNMMFVSKSVMVMFVIIPLLTLNTISAENYYILDTKMFHMYALSILYCSLLVVSDRACSIFIMFSKLTDNLRNTMNFVTLFVSILTLAVQLLIVVQIMTNIPRSDNASWDSIFDLNECLCILLLFYSLFHFVYQVFLKTRPITFDYLDNIETALQPASIFAICFILYSFVNLSMNASKQNKFLSFDNAMKQDDYMLQLVSGFHVAGKAI